MTKAQRSAFARQLARERWAKAPDSQRAALREFGKLGGRPKTIVECGKCHARGGTVEMRRHRCALIL